MPESKRRKPKYDGPTQSKKPKEVNRAPSPTWYVVLMFAMMALGVALVLLRYFLSWDNIVLIVGLGFIAGGFLMTTSYR
ncbi:MAG: cell division protein CrgA [Acidimicrobiia bacterium]|nr:cell division protein CrgA [Acidimicrobiia bacterium]